MPAIWGVSRANLMLFHGCPFTPVPGTGRPSELHTRVKGVCLPRSGKKSRWADSQFQEHFKLTLPPGPLSWKVPEGQMAMPACFAGEARLQPPPLIKQKFYREPGLPGSAEAPICPRRTARGTLPRTGPQGWARQGATARPSCPAAPGFPVYFTGGPPRRPQRARSGQGRAIHPLLSPNSSYAPGLGREVETPWDPRLGPESQGAAGA